MFIYDVVCLFPGTISFLSSMFFLMVMWIDSVKIRFFLKVDSTWYTRIFTVVALIIYWGHRRQEDECISKTSQVDNSFVINTATYVDCHL